MNPAEIDILKEFRRYKVSVGSMLFFNSGRASSHTPQFKRAILSLIQQRFMTRARHVNAFSLTSAGHSVSLAISAKERLESQVQAKKLATHRSQRRVIPFSSAKC